MRATLALNPSHPIFAGHFPGQPVVPGACQLQIVQEVLSHLTGRDLRLQKADQIKFLTPIDPRHYPRLQLDLHYAPAEPLQPNANPAGGVDLHPLTASLSADGKIFLKFTGTFRAV